MQLWGLFTNSSGSADNDKRIIETLSYPVRMVIMYKIRMCGVFFREHQGAIMPSVHLW